MERLNPDDPLAAYLAANRAHANAVFARARRQNARLTPDAFAEFACGTLAQLIRAVGALSPDHALEAAGACFDVALGLFAQNLLGPDTRSPAVAGLWHHVLPRVARWLAEDPQRVAAGLSNIVFNVEREQVGVATRWADALPAVSAACDSSRTFLDAALVLAWRCGMAHHRGGALARWRGLPPPARLITLGLPPDGRGLSETELDRRMADPWLDPATGNDASPGELRVVARVGGFQGLGGPFVRPPQVACVQGAILAFDREGCWGVHADCFGATLMRAGTHPPSHTDLPAAGFVVSTAGVVTRRGLTRTIPELRDVTSFASTEWTLAVTLRHSHRVHLVALTRPEVP